MLTHKGTQVIETERLILRQFLPEDRQAMYDNWASDPAVTKYMRWPPHADPGVTGNLLSLWISQYDHENFYHWAIVPKALGEPIGSIAVVSIEEKVCCAAMGYCIGAAWWHQGYTSEALKAVIDYLFDQVGFLRIEAQHHICNPNSGAVMQKCGMRYEGTHRQAAWCNQGICDVSWYAILKEERSKPV